MSNGAQWDVHNHLRHAPPRRTDPREPFCARPFQSGRTQRFQASCSVVVCVRQCQLVAKCGRELGRQALPRPHFCRSAWHGGLLARAKASRYTHKRGSDPVVGTAVDKRFRPNMRWHVAGLAVQRVAQPLLRPA